MADPLWMRAALLFCLLLAAPGSALSVNYQGTPANYQSLLNGLQPGDVLQLAAGTYPNGLSITDLHGTADQPIVITGPESGDPALFTGRSCCNTVQIRDSSYVEIRHLKLDGLGIDGIDGVNGRFITHHITISNFHIVGHGGGQQTNGISTKGPAWDWVIRENVIEGAGTGMYLGDSTGEQPFVNGVIERNLIIDTIGYNMQIKHQNPRPLGIGMPSGDSRTVIRHNVFSKSENSSTGGLARPNLLVGHLPLSGPGQDDVYEIYGNFFYQNPTESLFQGEGNIALYSNLFVNDFGTAVAIQPHNDVPRRVLVFRNTVVADGTGIRVTGGATGFERRVFANAVFAGEPISAADSSDNITGTRASASSHLRAPFSALGDLDLFPLAGALNGAAVDLSGVAEFTDSGLDFDTRPLPGNWRGAYAGDAGGAAWPPALQIKPLDGDLPAVSFSASATSVAEGDGVQLVWNVSDAGSCEAGGAWDGARPLSGSEDSGPLTEDSTFTLECTGSGGTTLRSITITIEDESGGDGGTLIDSAASSLIDSLTVQDQMNAGAWSVRNGLQVDDQMYGDRPYAAVTIPGELAGADWIRTANDSREFNGAILASFVTGAPVDVYVAHRDDISSKPAWLDPWTDTGLQLVNDEPENYSLYRRSFDSGETVNFGPSGSISSGMYIVVVLPANGDGGSGDDGGGDVGEAPLPYQPILPPQPNQPVGGAFVEGAPYTDPNGGALIAVDWEIMQTGNGRSVFDRRIGGRSDLRVPLGVLQAGEIYQVRVRHQNSLGQFSDWSEPETFEAEPWNDSDGDGTHDFYQVGVQEDDAVCRMRHPEGGLIELTALSAGTRIRCLAIVELESLELAAETELTVDDVPYGFPAFRIEGIAVNPGDPAQVSAMINLPRDLGDNASWYRYDHAAGVLVDASNQTSGLTNTSRQVIITIVDGSDGDADGVVNGVIVVQAGLVAIGDDSQVVGGADDGNVVDDDAEGGPGSASLVELLFGFLILISILMSRMRCDYPGCQASRCGRSF